MASNSSEIQKGSAFKFFESKKGAAFIGGVCGATAFGVALYASPALIQAATYSIAGVVAGVLGASLGVYLGAMIAVAVAAALVGALIALALRAAVNHIDNMRSHNSSQTQHAPAAQPATAAQPAQPATAVQPVTDVPGMF